MRQIERNGGAPLAVVENIKTILGLENAALRARTGADRISDGIASSVGTLTFVLVHAAWFIAWAVINAGLIPFIPAFDPYPFQLLCMIVSMEGVLLSTLCSSSRTAWATSPTGGTTSICRSTCSPSAR
jgi:uncharacterized membrane protein